MQHQCSIVPVIITFSGNGMKKTPKKAEEPNPMVSCQIESPR